MRELVKATVRVLALVVASPALLSFAIRSPIMGRNRALEGSSQALAWLPGVFGQYLRRAFLSLVLTECAPTATICYGVLFSQAGARIGARAYVGPGCQLGLVDIEDDVLIGSGVQITSGRHTHGTGTTASPIRDQEGSRVRVRIGRGAWIGAGAIVMADVGCDAVVGAGAVVTSRVPDAVVAAGVPARVIRSRNAASPASPS